MPKCVICQGHARNSRARTLECKHKFHKECIKKWFESSSRCPICNDETGRVHKNNIEYEEIEWDDSEESEVKPKPNMIDKINKLLQPKPSKLIQKKKIKPLARNLEDSKLSAIERRKRRFQAENPVTQK